MSVPPNSSSGTAYVSTLGTEARRKSRAVRKANPGSALRLCDNYLPNGRCLRLRPLASLMDTPALGSGPPEGISMRHMRDPFVCRLGIPASSRLSLLLLLVTMALPRPARAASPTTVTTLTISPAGGTVAAGSAVTLTASVAAGGAPVTAGLVYFCDIARCLRSAQSSTMWV